MPLAADYPRIRLRLSAIGGAGPQFRHVLDDAQTRGADGALHDMPRMRVIGATTGRASARRESGS